MNGQDTRVMIFAVSVALLSPPAKAAPWSVELSAQEEAVLVSAEELRKAERALLEGQSGSDRLHALLTVLRHASGYSALPGELERLLVRATADPNREVAELAERALFLRSNPPEPEAGTEEEIRARRAARELLEIEEALTGWQGSPESRFDARAAIRRLAHHATKHYVWSPEIEWMVERGSAPRGSRGRPHRRADTCQARRSRDRTCLRAVCGSENSSLSASRGGVDLCPGTRQGRGHPSGGSPPTDGPGSGKRHGFSAPCSCSRSDARVPSGSRFSSFSLCGLHGGRPRWRPTGPAPGLRRPCRSVGPTATLFLPSPAEARETRARAVAIRKGDGS